MRRIERHGKMVWEDEVFDEYRRKNSLCYHCEHCKPGQPDNCSISEKFYSICKQHGCALILTRCQDWEPNDETDEPS